jgi:hypothetical protein
MMVEQQSSEVRTESAEGSKGNSGRLTLEPDFARAAGIVHEERTIARRLSNVLRFNDFMTFMMVLATAFSAYATWRTAYVTNLLFAIAERPYIGVEQVTIDSLDASFARVVVDCRNFGSVAANDGVARIGVIADGKPVLSETAAADTVNVGIVSPTVPHRIFRYVPRPIYERVRGGKARMVVSVVFNYRGPDQRHFCYNEMMVYDMRTASFVSGGGSDRCGSEVY